MNHEKTFNAISKLKDIEMELHRLKNALEIANKSLDAQRTWVELTEDDKVLIKHDANFNQFMTAGEYADRVQALTEARLKDKNT
jgi:hypothetical protein